MDNRRTPYCLYLHANARLHYRNDKHPVFRHSQCQGSIKGQNLYCPWASQWNAVRCGIYRPRLCQLGQSSFCRWTDFDIPGLGRLYINAISNRDDTLILRIINLYAILILLSNTMSDVFQVWLIRRQKICL
jgi:hypothetical protein